MDNRGTTDVEIIMLERNKEIESTIYKVVRFAYSRPVRTPIRHKFPWGFAPYTEENNLSNKQKVKDITDNNKINKRKKEIKCIWHLDFSCFAVAPRMGGVD